MKTLIWKEWRDQRIWAALVVASSVGVVAAGQGYTFSGSLSTYTRLIWLSFIVALFFGASSFSRDLAAGSVDFLYARPASWKRILLAKLTVGFAIIASAALIALLVYRLVAADEYVGLLTASRAAQGVGTAIALMGAAYVIGMACSVVLPGTIGGTLTLMVTLLLLAVTAHGLRFGVWVLQLPLHRHWLPAWIGLGWGVGVLGAAIMTLRFGITLPVGPRMRRYAMFFIASLLLAACMDVFLPKGVGVRLYEGIRVKSSVSPDGKYALLDRAVNYGEARYSGLIPQGGAWRLMRLSDGAVSGAEEASEFVDFHWRPEGLLLIKYSADVQIEDIRMDHAGQLIRRRASVGRVRGYPRVFAIPSPNGSLVALHVQFQDERKNFVDFLDVDSMRRLDRRIFLRGRRVTRWIAEDGLQLLRPTSSGRGYETVRVFPAGDPEDGE